MMERTQLLDSYLKALRLPCFLAHYRRFAEDAAGQHLCYDRFLLALCEQEVRQREQNRQIRRIKQARFPVQKELSDFDFSTVPDPGKQQVLQLAQGEYIRAVEPIIMVGNPGSGKTHVATALGLCACHQGSKVRFYNAAGLVNEMITARDEHRLNKFLSTALNQQLIVIDELGFIPLSTTGAQLLFQFCSALYERVALIVTTNLRFADWTQILGNEQLAAALLDRLTHRAHILEFTGESFRFRERMKRASKVDKKEKNTG